MAGVGAAGFATRPFPLASLCLDATEAPCGGPEAIAEQPARYVG